MLALVPTPCTREWRAAPPWFTRPRWSPNVFTRTWRQVQLFWSWILASYVCVCVRQARLCHQSCNGWCAVSRPVLFLPLDAVSPAWTLAAEPLGAQPSQDGMGERCCHRFSCGIRASGKLNSSSLSPPASDRKWPTSADSTQDWKAKAKALLQALALVQFPHSKPVPLPLAGGLFPGRPVLERMLTVYIPLFPPRSGAPEPLQVLQNKEINTWDENVFETILNKNENKTRTLFFRASFFFFFYSQSKTKFQRLSF